VLLLSASAVVAQRGAPQRGAPAAPKPYLDTIPGTLTTFEMVPVPGGTVQVDGPEGPRTITIAPFYMGRTEVTWDMFDIYALRLDDKTPNAAADVIARPSRPYAVPDYEWGHDGYAAISIGFEAAKAFCQWLSAKTGQEYRLATEAEWQHAASLAVGKEPLTRERIDSLAWHKENAGKRTHPVATKQRDALGLYDLFGNVAEWVLSANKPPVTRGGSFRDDPSVLGPGARAVQQDIWSERDPQLPKSTWWLSDGPFVGFRIVRDQ
jgi:formylglycine-generating enzyme required for sulfatase activity